MQLGIVFQAPDILLQIGDVFPKKFGSMLLLKILFPFFMGEFFLCLDLHLLPVLAIAYDAHLMLFDYLVVLF